MSTQSTVHPVAWSPDGKFLAYNTINPASKKFEIWLLPVSGDRKPFVFQKGDANFLTMTFSSDGRWLVYVSNESSRSEVYVTPFLVPIIEKNNGLEFGQSRVLFGGHNFSDANAGAFSSDFKKMLVSLSTKAESANSLVMVNNWRSELAK